MQLTSPADLKEEYRNSSLNRKIFGLTVEDGRQPLSGVCVPGQGGANPPEVGQQAKDSDKSPFSRIKERTSRKLNGN